MSPCLFAGVSLHCRNSNFPPLPICEHIMPWMTDFVFGKRVYLAIYCSYLVFFFRLTGRFKMKAWSAPFLHFWLHLWIKARFLLSNMISPCLNWAKLRQTALVWTDWNHLDLTHDTTDSQWNVEFRIVSQVHHLAWKHYLSSRLNELWMLLDDVTIANTGMSVIPHGKKRSWRIFYSHVTNFTAREKLLRLQLQYDVCMTNQCGEIYGDSTKNTELLWILFVIPWLLRMVNPPNQWSDILDIWDFKSWWLYHQIGQKSRAQQWRKLYSFQWPIHYI